MIKKQCRIRWADITCISSLMGQPEICNTTSVAQYSNKLCQDAKRLNKTGMREDQAFLLAVDIVDVCVCVRVV